MRFSVRRGTVLLSFIVIACFCSCERHHVGELPPDPSLEHTHQAPAESEVTPASRHTPANFFPQTTKP